MTKRKKGNFCRMLWGLWGMAVFLLPAWAQAAAPYSLVDLGALHGGTHSVAYDINDAGQIVGVAYNASGEGHAVIWENGVIRDLGTLGGDYSEALGVNATGSVCGYSKDQNNKKCAFVWSRGTMTPLLSDKEESKGYAINASGQVAGYYKENRKNIGFVWTDGVLTGHDDFTAARRSYCFDINDVGQVTGWIWLDDGTEQGFLLSGTELATLGTLTPDSELASEAYALNNQGHIVGEARNEERKYRPFLWTSGGMEDLGLFDIPGHPEGSSGEALGINDSDHVVGSVIVVSGESSHAFLYDGTSMKDLNLEIEPGSSWTLAHARAINNKGWIVGDGEYAGLQGSRAFLLKPRGPEWAGLKGTVKGVVAGEPVVLKGARVRVAGAGMEAVTNDQGRFILDDVPEGVYDVTLTMGGFLAQTIAQVTVTGGEMTVLSEEACVMQLGSTPGDVNDDGDVDVVDTIGVLKVLTGQ